MTLFLRFTKVGLIRFKFSGRRYSSSAEHFDIIIGGGGLVGSTLAASLVSNRTLADKRILLLEAGPKRKPFDVKERFGKRVSAINRSSLDLFKSINVFDYMQERRIKPVKQMQVWESKSDATIQFQHENFAKDVACIIENNLIIDAMHNLLEKHENFQQENSARIKKVSLPVETKVGFSKLCLQDGRNYTCELLIGADGCNSIVRKQMGVEPYTANYQRTGIIATLELSEACDNSVAWQRFTPAGAVALLPLDEKHSSLVWNATIPQAKQLLEMTKPEFVDAINEAFCKQYSRNDLADRAVMAINSFCGRNEANRQYPPRVCGVQAKSIAAFPLSFLHAPTYACTGAAIVGDAAHRIHPLAGQGANLGFSDVRFLVDALSKGSYAGSKLSDKQYLIEYEQNALRKNTPVIFGIHAMHMLYATDISPIVLMRSVGLQLTQNLTAVKSLFMNQAMG